MKHDRGFESLSNSTRLSQKKPRNYLDPRNNRRSAGRAGYVFRRIKRIPDFRLGEADPRARCL